MNYYGTSLQAQSFSLPPCRLMSPLTTLTSAAFRRKMMRGEAKIDLFVLQRDQMLYESLEYTGKLGGEALRLYGSVDAGSSVSISPDPIVRKNIQIQLMWFGQSPKQEGKLETPLKGGWDPFGRCRVKLLFFHC